MSNETATPTTPDTTKVDSVEVKEVVVSGEPEKVLYPDAKTPEGTQPVEDAKATEVPEKYELKLTEGSPLDQSAVDRIAAFAKAQGLSGEAAQALLKTEESAVVSFSQQKLQEHMLAREEWVKEIKADQEYGGDKFNQNLEIAKKIMTKYGDEELNQVLNETGYGNKKAVFKFMVNIGKELKVMGDTFVPATQAASPPPKHAHDIFYPKKEE